MKYTVLLLSAVILFAACKEKEPSTRLWDYSCTSNTTNLVFKRIYSSYAADSGRAAQLGADSALRTFTKVVADTFYNLDTTAIVHNLDSLNTHFRIYPIPSDSIAKQSGTYSCVRIM